MNPFAFYMGILGALNPSVYLGLGVYTSLASIRINMVFQLYSQVMFIS